MFVNVFKFVHVVFATLYNRVDMRDELESKVTPRFLVVGVGEMLLPWISIGKEDTKSLRGHLLPMSKNSVLSGFSFNLFLYIQSWTETREF